MTNQQDKKLTRMIKILESAERKSNLPAEDLLNLLPINKSDNILDLGVGTGFLAIPAAQKTKETLYALDINVNMLHYLAEKAQNEKINNIKTVEGDFKNIPLEDNLIDITLASLSLHEVDPLSAALKDVHRVMKNNGHLLCVEFEKNEDTAAPRVHSSVMEEELRNAGFTIKEKRFPDNKIMDQALYIIIAQKQD